MYWTLIYGVLFICIFFIRRESERYLQYKETWRERENNIQRLQYIYMNIEGDRQRHREGMRERERGIQTEGHSA